MSVSCQEVIEAMEALAPVQIAEEWDNVGLLVGNREKPIQRILVALDAIGAVIDEALYVGADLIITHHPIIFKPIQSIDTKTSLGRKLMKLIQNDIGVYAAHTNLDKANGGTNDALFQRIGLKNKDFLGRVTEGEGGYALGRVGDMQEPVPLETLAKQVKEALCAQHIILTGPRHKMIYRVGLCTGSAATPDFFKMAKQMGCQAYITGDVTYHNAQAALEMDLALIDATHYAAENIVTDSLVAYLIQQFESLDDGPEIIKSEVDGQTLFSI